MLVDTSQEDWDLIRSPFLPSNMLFRGLSWVIGDPVQEIKFFDESGISDGDNYDRAFISDTDALNKFLDTVFLKGYQHTRIYIVMQIGRTLFSNRAEMLEISIPCTPRQILDAISAVFQRTATAEFVDTHKTFDNGHGDASIEVLRMLEMGEIARNYHLQGGLVFFEGLRQIDTNVYMLDLGS
jgi:hypothetical protein